MHLGKHSQHCQNTEAPPSQLPSPCFPEEDRGTRRLGNTRTVTQPQGWTRGQLRSPPAVDVQNQLPLPNSIFKTVGANCQRPLRSSNYSPTLGLLLVCAGGTQTTQRHTPPLTSTAGAGPACHAHPASCFLLSQTLLAHPRASKKPPQSVRRERQARGSGFYLQ